MGPHVQRKQADVLTLWATKRFDTSQIADMFMMRETDVERVIHADRESKRAA